MRCLTAIRPDACALANNHIFDFGVRGLSDTLHALTDAGIRGVGAGLDAEEAERPAVVTLGDGGHGVIAACGMQSSGIPPGGRRPKAGAAWPFRTRRIAVPPR